MSSFQIDQGLSVVLGWQFPHCNALVIDSDELVVIDPGCPFEKLRAALREIDREIRDIDTIILSHIHPDHITHAAKIHRLSGCRIAANEITAPLFNDKEQMKRFLGFIPENPVRPLWEELVNERMFGALDNGRIDEVLQEGDKYAIGEYTLRMVMTPGHLPDHMCIKIEEPNLLFAADIDCTSFGPYYGHPNSSITEFEKSVHKIQEGDYAGIISGHLEEPLITDYHQRLEEYWDFVRVREKKVLQAIMAGARSLDEIVSTPIIYPSLLSAVFIQFEKWMIELHIDSLILKGEIEDNDGILSPI
ncbi:MAG: MBL fold metallo-hydrolase [Candidatus Thorarchaeota archaeon]